MIEDVKYLSKIEYETKLANYLKGLFISTTVLFVIGKIIGYFDISWWWIISPFAVTLFGSIVNYLDWVPNNRILLYTLGFLFMVLRYVVLRIILWLPIFTSLITGYCIFKKYGTRSNMVLIEIAAVLLTYFFTVKISGKSPQMPK